MYIAAIPTMYFEQAKPLVDKILSCEGKPDIVYILNNSEVNFQYGGCEVINYGKNIGVNPALNHALELAAKHNAHLSFLNDDIIIRRNFFIRTRTALSQDIVKVICPKIFRRGKYRQMFFDYDINKPVFLQFMSVRSGCAFTIKDKYIKNIPPIPKQFLIFFGDDWIYEHTMPWILDVYNPIFHKVGGTLRRNPELRKRLLKEKREWNKYWRKRENG